MQHHRTPAGSEGLNDDSNSDSSESSRFQPLLARLPLINNVETHDTQSRTNNEDTSPSRASDRYQQHRHHNNQGTTATLIPPRSHSSSTALDPFHNHHQTTQTSLRRHHHDKYNQHHPLPPNPNPKIPTTNHHTDPENESINTKWRAKAEKIEEEQEKGQKTSDGISNSNSNKKPVFRVEWARGGKRDGGIYDISWI
ncbi:MAG: hypothetical protein M1834_004981 [Cirrosporium novae-zelandiae]|nr:MAG: hypothetical protein M1834_004981 [Cirrosporium novae-zelandiae]